MQNQITASGIADWVPLFSELVWPIFVLVLILLFREQVGAAFRQVLAAVGEGRAVQIGDWLRIGEATTIDQLEAPNRETEPSSLDISVEHLGLDYGAATKGTATELQQLRGRLERNPGKRIEVLLITDRLSYSTEMIKRYIATLGVRYLVFLSNGLFDGWIEASVFVLQLPDNDEHCMYRDLRNSIVGIADANVSREENVLNILRRMEEMNIESLAVVENGLFQFMVNRGTILSKLMTRSLVSTHES